MPSANVIYMGIVVPAAVLLPIAIAIGKRKYIGRALTVILYYLLVGAVTSIVTVTLANLAIPNLPVLHVFTILEFLLFSYFYLLMLKGKTAGRIIRYLMILFPLFCVVNFLFFQSVYHFNTNTRPVEALILMMCSLAYFAQINDTATGAKWTSNPVNWMNTGVLLYFSGALFIFSFSNVTASHLTKKYFNINILMWNIHATLLLFMYLLFALGFSKCRKLYDR
jgi:hypothetical protein